MAKALMGHLHTVTPQSPQAENRRLRQRIADLEALVLRLQAENDALSQRATDLVSA